VGQKQEGVAGLDSAAGPKDLELVGQETIAGVVVVSGSDLLAAEGREVEFLI
jgi:hypothetical protein